MDVATIIGAIAVVTCMMVGIGSNLPSMLDVPSLIIVVGGTLGALLVSFPLDFTVRLGTYLRWAVWPPRSSDDPAGDRRDLEDGIRYFRRARTYAFAMGWVGLLIGGVIILKHLDLSAGADTAWWPRGLAIGSLTVLWGTFLGYVVCLPLQTKLEIRLRDLDTA